MRLKSRFRLYEVGCCSFSPGPKTLPQRASPGIDAGLSELGNQLLVDRLPVAELDVPHAFAGPLKFREVAEQQHAIEHLEVRIGFEENDSQEVVAVIGIDDVAPLHLRAKLRGSGKNDLLNGLGSFSLLRSDTVIESVDQRRGLKRSAHGGWARTKRVLQEY